MRTTLTLLLSVFCAALIFAQDVPQGMKYQAVARDANGELIADQDVSLKIALKGYGQLSNVYYVEVHKVRTTDLGLFAVTIGEGDARHGDFDAVPWSSDEIWMQVSMDRDGDNDFLLVSESKMLSVPYAFHSMTASRLAEAQSDVGEDGKTPDPGSDSNNWHTDGNTGTDPTNDFLGTTDEADLVIITNDTERIRVLVDGDVLVDRSQRIGQNLEVRKNTDLNTESGETRNYGDFTVMDQSSTLLSGTLTVDKATDLNLSLNVDGKTDLNSSLDVNNASPTHLTGTLLVDGTTRFSNTTQSTSRYDGSVTMAGGVGIDSNLNVGGNFDVRGSSAFGGPVGFEDVVTISTDSQSVSTGTGALIVYGGVGIGRNLNVGESTNLGGTLYVEGAANLNNTLTVAQATTLNGATQVNNTFTVGPHASALGGTLNVANATTLQSTLAVSGATNLNNTLDVSGITNITNTTASTSKTNGALKVAGGVGINGALNVGGAMKLENTFEVVTAGGTSFAPSGGSLGTGHIARFENTTDGSGIIIKVGSTQPQNKNDFITFVDKNNKIVGRIEGESTNADLANNKEYQDDVAFLSADVAFAVVNGVIGILDLTQAGFKLVASITSTTACVGLGVCVTAPIVSFIVESGSNLILEIAQGVMLAAEIAKVSANLGVYIQTHKQLLGITFASGSGDYAEYLPRSNSSEAMDWGEIVGLKNGQISRNTAGADRIMVISRQPIVLGAVPDDGNVDAYEKVAFLGQVPTRIMGQAKKGDYILDSGFNNGFGVARNPQFMTIDDYDRIVGVCWEDSEDKPLNIVNVAVGLNTNDLTTVLKQQAEELEAQRNEIEGLKSYAGRSHEVLSQLIPGYGQAVNFDLEASGHEGHQYAGPYSNNASSGGAVSDHHEDLVLDRTVPSDIVYYEVSQEEIDAMFVQARKVFEESGVSIEDHPFWQRIDQDPNYKLEVETEIKARFENAVHTHKDINEQLGN